MLPYVTKYNYVSMIKPRKGDGSVKIKNTDNIHDPKKVTDKSLRDPSLKPEGFIQKKPERPKSNRKKCSRCRKTWLATNGDCPQGGYCEFG